MAALSSQGDKTHAVLPPLDDALDVEGLVVDVGLDEVLLCTFLGGGEGGMSS